MERKRERREDRRLHALCLRIYIRSEKHQKIVRFLPDLMTAEDIYRQVGSSAKAL